MQVTRDQIAQQAYDAHEAKVVEQTPTTYDGYNVCALPWKLTSESTKERFRAVADAIGPRCHEILYTGVHRCMLPCWHKDHCQ